MQNPTVTRPSFERMGRTGLQVFLVCVPVNGEEIQRMSPSAMATGFRGDRAGEKAAA